MAAKLDADHKAAIGKCDGLAGDAKGACVAAAKVKFGKSCPLLPRVVSRGSRLAAAVSTWPR